MIDDGNDDAVRRNSDAICWIAGWDYKYYDKMSDSKKSFVNVKRGETAFMAAIVIGLLVGLLVKKVSLSLMLGLLIGLGIVFLNQFRVKR